MHLTPGTLSVRRFVDPRRAVCTLYCFARAPDNLSQGDAFFTDACPGPEPWDRLLPPAAP